MRTISYSDLKDRFTSAIGVDSLLSVEESAFKRSLNDRIRGIWTRAKWPPLTTVVEKTIAAVNVATLKAEKAVQIDNATDLFDVHAVYDRNPYSDSLAKRSSFGLSTDISYSPIKSLRQMSLWSALRCRPLTTVTLNLIFRSLWIVCFWRTAWETTIAQMGKTIKP